MNKLGVRDLRYAIKELQYLRQFEPKLQTHGTKEELKNTLYLIKIHLNYADAKYISSLTNWVLQELKINEWKGTLFKKPYFGTQLETYIQTVKQKVREKHTIKHLITNPNDIINNPFEDNPNDFCTMLDYILLYRNYDAKVILDIVHEEGYGHITVEDIKSYTKLVRLILWWLQFYENYKSPKTFIGNKINENSREYKRKQKGIDK